MKKQIVLFSMTVVLLAGIPSCQKSETKDLSSTSAATSTNLTAAVSAAVASVATTQINQASTEDIQSVAMSKFDAMSLPGRDHMGFPSGPMHFDIPRISSCATVTVSDTTYPKTVTIDYGSGCSDGRGPVKKGKIIIVISDTLVAAGSVKTITTQDFYIDSNKVELSSTLKNLGKNAAGNWVIADNYTQKTTGANGNIVVETNSDTVEWISGFTTVDKSDDVFNKTGSGSITVNDTIAFSKKITKTLAYDNSCGYIKSGTIELYQKGNTIIIDYGDGTCDDVATVTTNGTTETINLKSHGFKEGGEFDNHCGAKMRGGRF
jgi:hypothetical protein